MRDAVDDVYGGAVDTDSAYIHVVMTIWMTMMITVMMTVEMIMC